MVEIKAIGKFVIFAGISLVLTGAVLYFVSKIPGGGRLPGDIVIQKKNVSFYFPVTTCIIVSVILTLMFLLFFRR